MPKEEQAFDLRYLIKSETEGDGGAKLGYLFSTLIGKLSSATVRPKAIAAVKERANFFFTPHRHEQGSGHQAECENIASAMLLLIEDCSTIDLA